MTGKAKETFRENRRRFSDWQDSHNEYRSVIGVTMSKFEVSVGLFAI